MVPFRQLHRVFAFRESTSVRLWQPEAVIRPGIDVDYPSCGTSPRRGPLFKTGQASKTMAGLSC